LNVEGRARYPMALQAPVVVWIRDGIGLQLLRTIGVTVPEQVERYVLGANPEWISLRLRPGPADSSWSTTMVEKAPINYPLGIALSARRQARIRQIAAHAQQTLVPIGLRFQAKGWWKRRALVLETVRHPVILRLVVGYRQYRLIIGFRNIDRERTEVVYDGLVRHWDRDVPLIRRTLRALFKQFEAVS